MAFTDQYVVPFEAGVHYGTLGAFAAHFRPGTIALNGLDPTDMHNADALAGINKGDPVDIVANTGDPQTDRDAVHIAEGLIQQGRDPWQKAGQRMSLPIERYNQAANYVRSNWLGLPPEEAQPQAAPQQIAQASIAKWSFIKGSPYPGHHSEHPKGDKKHLKGEGPTNEKANEIYHAIERDNPDEDESSAAAIAWSQAEKHEKSKKSSDVSSDMTVTSKWKVVALGELQQPGGVAATQEYNPVVDGPNPDGPQADNASNSPEQEVAMQTWINMAVDELNRGEDPQAIIARLAHDGCPDPQSVLQRAQQQPMEEPGQDSLGQDPFQAPPPADQTGEMQGLSQQPATLAKRVRIAGTTMIGTELDRWEGMWGEGQVKIALDEGGTMTVAPEAVQPVEGEEIKHPVSEIQSFIDSMPEVEPTRPHIEARLANLELVRRAVRANISRVALSDQVKLQAMDTKAEEETVLLKESLGNFVDSYEVNYVSQQPRFSYNAFETATPEITAWAGRPKEAGAIWAAENFDAPNKEMFAAAAHYASNLGLTGSQFQEFLAGADSDTDLSTYEKENTECPHCHTLLSNEQRDYCQSCGKPVKGREANYDNEGPAEALFLR